MRKKRLQILYNNVIIDILNNAFVIESGCQPLSILLCKGIFEGVKACLKTLQAKAKTRIQ